MLPLFKLQVAVITDYVGETATATVTFAEIPKAGDSYTISAVGAESGRRSLAFLV